MLVHPAEGKRRIRLRHGGRPEDLQPRVRRRHGPGRHGRDPGAADGGDEDAAADAARAAGRIRLRARAQRHREPVHGVRAAGGVAPREGHRPPQEAGLRKAARRHRRRPLSGQENRPRDGQPDTHRLSTLYGTFGPAEASRPADRFEVHHTPKHGSWLNMAETGTDVLSRQCPARRIPDREAMVREAGAWQAHRNPSAKPVDWRFRTGDARVKLKSLYPSQQ